MLWRSHFFSLNFIRKWEFPLPHKVALRALLGTRLPAYLCSATDMGLEKTEDTNACQSWATGKRIETFPQLKMGSHTMEHCMKKSETLGPHVQLQARVLSGIAS